MTAMSTVVLTEKSPGAENSKIPPIGKGKKSTKNYKLRDASLKKREEMENRKNQPRKRGPKPRPKSAPMSKYRRKTANLRERLRMGEINVAFEKLRDKLPNPMQQAGKAKCEKLTKINILHVAINYIRAMENLLETGNSHIASFSELTKNPLRDESEKKVEMQRVLQTLMARADKVHHQSRSRRRPDFDNDDDDDEMDDLNEMDEDENNDQTSEEEEEDDNEEEESQFLDPCASQYIPPTPADTSWTSTSSTDSGIASDPLLSRMDSISSNHSSGKSATLNNNNDDIMKEFTDFVDLVDSLQGMPDIDFEDNFEMFP